MKKNLIALVISAALLASGCRALTPAPQEATLPEATRQPTAVPTATPAPTETPEGLACDNGDCVSTCLGALVDSGRLAPQDHPIDEEFTSEEGVELVRYEVVDDGLYAVYTNPDIPEWLVPFRDDEDFHLQLWEMVSAMLPDDIRPYLQQFSVMSDGVDNTLASVYQTDADMRVWALDIDIVDTRNTEDLVGTIVHELSHLITLNPSQMDPSQAIFDAPEDDQVYQQEMDACPYYFPGEGCTHADSFLNAFYDRFWVEADYFDDWLAVEEITDQDAYYDAQQELYQKYQDEFVTDYAVTNPDEDMAESFYRFVLYPRPAGDTIADQKILFFYEYPEFMQIRQDMAQALCRAAGVE